MHSSKSSSAVTERVVLAALVIGVIILAEIVLLRGRLPGRSEEHAALPDPPPPPAIISGTMSREEIFNTLTKNTWCNRDRPRDNPFFHDYTVYILKPDGTSRSSFVTDHAVPSSTGSWNFEQDSTGAWILLYDTGRRERFALDESGALVFDYTTLKPCDPITTEKKYDASTLPPLQISPGAKLTAEKITAHRWKRANDVNLHVRPTLIEFQKNFEYITTYHYGECQNSGWWYAVANDIRGNSSTAKCYKGHGTFRESFSAEILDNGFLLLIGDLYAPENHYLEKGVVIEQSDGKQIEFEYDMPIQVGVPNRFDVEIAHLGKGKRPEAIILQKFSITENHVKHYRQPDNTIKRVDEIASKDLESRVLQPGERHNFSLDVTFEKPGKQLMYIHGLMYDGSQNQDIHTSYSINVQES